MTETPNDNVQDPQAGLSATGRTADQFSPGEEAGTDYGAAGGIGTDDQETTAGEGAGSVEG